MSFKSMTGILPALALLQACGINGSSSSRDKSEGGKGGRESFNLAPKITVGEMGSYSTNRATFMTPVVNPVYASLNESNVPKIYSKIYSPVERKLVNDPNPVKSVDYGGALTPGTSEHMMITQPITNDFRVPTKCVITALETRRTALGRTPEEFERLAVDHGVTLLPIDETKVSRGSERILYSTGVIRFSTPSGGDYVGVSCNGCHAVEMNVQESPGVRKQIYRHGQYGGGIAKDSSYGADLFYEGAERALIGPNNKLGCGNLTTEEAITAARLVDALYEKDVDGKEVGLKKQREYVSKSSFIASSQATVIAHMSVGTLVRGVDFTCDMYGKQAPGEHCTSDGFKDVPFDQKFLSRDRNHILGYTKEVNYNKIKVDPMRNVREAMSKLYKPDFKGVLNQQYNYRPSRNWYAVNSSGMFSARAFSGSYGCTTEQGLFIECGAETHAQLLMLPLSNRYVMGPLDPDVVSKIRVGVTPTSAGTPLPIGQPGELPLDYPGKHNALVPRYSFLSPTYSLEKSLKLHSELRRKTAPDPIPNIATANNIKVEALRRAVKVANTNCLLCHAPSKGHRSVEMCDPAGGQN